MHIYCCFSPDSLCTSHAHSSLSAMLASPFLSLAFVYMETMPLDIWVDIFYFASNINRDNKDRSLLESGVWDTFLAAMVRLMLVKRSGSKKWSDDLGHIVMRSWNKL